MEFLKTVQEKLLLQVSAEEPSMLEVPIPWDDHQEERRQWRQPASRHTSEAVCAAEGRVRDNPSPLEESRGS